MHAKRRSCYWSPSLCKLFALPLTYASVHTASKPSLKSQLRELYKLIHPDRFHGFPPARDANEKSFKMLQEYLAAGDRSAHIDRISAAFVQMLPAVSTSLM